VNVSIVSGVKRAYNFNAGPAALPLPVLERVREELLDWHGTGMSVMEMSHRSPEFESINDAAEAGVRKVLGVPSDYAVIFVQGGGSMQFTMAPMNLCLPSKAVDVLHTGAWTAKAIAELAPYASSVVQTGERVRFEIPQEENVQKALEVILSDRARLISVNPVKRSLEDYFVQKIGASAESPHDVGNVGDSS